MFLFTFYDYDVKLAFLYNRNSKASLCKHHRLSSFPAYDNHFDNEISAGYSEDSDYTSDLNYPVGQHANSSASQFRSAAHQINTPQRSLETSRENSYERDDGPNAQHHLPQLPTTHQHHLSPGTHRRHHQVGTASRRTVLPKII